MCNLKPREETISRQKNRPFPTALLMSFLARGQDKNQIKKLFPVKKMLLII